MPRTRGESLSETESEGSDVNLLMREIKKDTTAICKVLREKNSSNITTCIRDATEAIDGLGKSLCDTTTVHL